MGKQKKAFETISQVIESDSTNERAYYERANFILMLKSIDDDKGETLKKDSSFYEIIGIFELIGKEQVYDYVIKDATKALDLKNDYVEALEVRAKAFIRNGNTALAIDDFSKIIKVNPENTSAYRTRGELFFSIEEHDKALSDYDKVIEKSNYKLPKLDAYYQRGTINLILKKYDKAASDFTYLIDNGASSDEVIYLRGTAFIGLGSFVDACMDYEIVKESNDINYRKMYNFYECDKHYLNRENFKPKECKKFKTGKFKYSNYSEKDIHIVRTEDEQIEQLPNGKLVCDIKWLSSTEYKLTYTESDLPSYKDKIGESIIVKIIEVKGNSYTCKVDIEGKLFKSTFIKIEE